MTPVSLAGSGLLILIIEGVLKSFGIEADATTVTGVVNSIVIAGGWLLLIIGQLRRPDLHFGLLRKN